MSNIKKHIEEFKKYRISTIVRTDSYNNAYRIVKASHEAGIKFIELTLTIPDAYKLIKTCREDFPDLFIGAGTVLTLEEAKKAVENKAQYLVSPVSNIEILKWSNDNDILFVAGALTPTEMYNLHINGAKLIKFFPATSMPMNYIQLIHNPHPNFELLATGGIDYENVDKFIKAGCIGCGVTADLGGASESLDYEEIVNIARKYVNKVNNI
ncbi:2-dehydro-3-deoxyphosphogluconate aldolase / (4S)-4-hydroxy-2-oxoglutarate aldolase [Spiroplasma corruscae]|uniref:2-dehydro-3-deoxyphosphogluconate aldolase / (4S)-4-hydroxy-2-oxoglutarate aldolase n=1 Tax=Spiroplasma corruscae TaxID=216934 RepID=A0A222EP84_9MOLU|nr:bifunctional 4-hydroxy-2-oxoglutarate aldolase/2-dehydro-3-deoxy-phosphogluconate aldolase [Spiroplasma corruscae]ASP28335.1 2-dehydro-3-deoxyphosphogluconate aldolase / (4S)-4-hydroxy-2-oxoglutarate aldolase [Spiroplasma corruscae]